MTDDGGQIIGGRLSSVPFWAVVLWAIGTLTAVASVMLLSAALPR